MSKSGVMVIWSDREYNTKTKFFKTDEKGVPENALIKARKYVAKLEKDLLNVRSTPRIEFVD